MEYVVALFGFGALLLLVGIVGGDVSFQGAVVPKVGRLPRFTLTVLGGVLVVVSGILWGMITLPDRDAGPPGATDGTPGPGTVAVTVRHELLATAHRSEILELFVDQRNVGTTTVTAERHTAMLELTLPSAGEYPFEAILVASTHTGDESRFTGAGVLDARSTTEFRVRINRSSAGVELVPVP